MTSRLFTRRILPCFVLGGVFIVAGQSCDAKSKSDAVRAFDLPPGSEGSVAPQVKGDAALETTDDPAAAAEEDQSPTACAKGGTECPEGLICCPRCCTSNLGSKCIKAADGKCPLPDLQVDPGALAESPYIENIDATECEVAEGSVGGPGKRRVLRFDANVPNSGLADLQLGNPDAGGANSPFQWAPCHKHFHFKNFAHYGLVDPQNGEMVVAGRKQAFCAMDSARVDRNAGVMNKYDCTQQGIQIGWEDSYPAGLPCQYIDITDLPKGTYKLQIHVNPDHDITETNYDNNTASVQVNIP